MLPVEPAMALQSLQPCSKQRFGQIQVSPRLWLPLMLAWRSRMLVLGLIVGATLAVAMVFARRSPDAYGMEPFGSVVQRAEWS
jgi:hypothetical protein